MAPEDLAWQAMPHLAKLEVSLLTLHNFCFHFPIAPVMVISCNRLLCFQFYLLDLNNIQLVYYCDAVDYCYHYCP